MSARSSTGNGNSSGSTRAAAHNADGGHSGALQERELVPGQKMTGFECTITVANIDQTIRAIEANGGRSQRRNSIYPPWAPLHTSSI